jgi:hypothetical protein
MRQVWRWKILMEARPTLVEIFKGVCGFCEKNSLEFPPTSGRPSILSFAQLLTLKIFWELSRVKDFKTFYHGPLRKILAEFFPKLPEYSGRLLTSISQERMVKKCEIQPLEQV